MQITEPFHITAEPRKHPTMGRVSSLGVSELELIRRTKALPCPTQSSQAGLAVQAGLPASWQGLPWAGSLKCPRQGREDSCRGREFWAQPEGALLLSPAQSSPAHYGQLEIDLKLPELRILQEKVEIKIFMWNLQVFKYRQLIYN